jgi:hypothetical protein
MNVVAAVLLFFLVPLTASAGSFFSSLGYCFAAERIKTSLDELAVKEPKAKAVKPSDIIDARFVDEFDKSATPIACTAGYSSFAVICNG